MPICPNISTFREEERFFDITWKTVFLPISAKIWRNISTYRRKLQFYFFEKIVYVWFINISKKIAFLFYITLKTGFLSISPKYREKYQYWYWQSHDLSGIKQILRRRNSTPNSCRRRETIFCRLHQMWWEKTDRPSFSFQMHKMWNDRMFANWSSVFFRKRIFWFNLWFC